MGDGAGGSDRGVVLVPVLEQPATPTLIRLEVEGPPVAKARARVVRHGNSVHSFTPDSTVMQERRVEAAWYEAGCPRIDGHLGVVAIFGFGRPAGHLNTKGEVNAAGKRATPGRGDLDNYLKLLLDALNHKAFEDDRKILSVDARKCWVASFVIPYSKIVLRPLPW
jgi:Holliday junction resolvase RusA-like endonuclease